MIESNLDVPPDLWPWLMDLMPLSVRFHFFVRLPVPEGYITINFSWEVWLHKINIAGAQTFPSITLSNALDFIDAAGDLSLPNAINFSWEVWLHKINIAGAQTFPSITLSNSLDFIDAAGDLSLPNADCIILWLHVVQAIEKR
jgi:hypothetical protein